MDDSKGGGEEFECILKEKPMEFVDKLDMEQERKRSKELFQSFGFCDSEDGGN